MTTARELRDLRTGLRLRARALSERSVQARADGIEAACRRLLASEHAEAGELRRLAKRTSSPTRRARR
jgi:hypothetical protein